MGQRDTKPTRDWLPSWIVRDGKSYQDVHGIWRQNFHVRWWHPGLWWALLRKRA